MGKIQWHSRLSGMKSRPVNKTWSSRCKKSSADGYVKGNYLILECPVSFGGLLFVPEMKIVMSRVGLRKEILWVVILRVAVLKAG